MQDQMANEIKLISGSSHPELSAKIAGRYASSMLGAGHQIDSAADALSRRQVTAMPLNLTFPHAQC